MIKRPTVFVLGAGASYPYGFPTGEGLVDEVIRLTLKNPTDDTFLVNGCSPYEVQCFGNDLANSDASSVDSFLEYRSDFLKVGKLAIAMSLIPKERDQALTRRYRQPTNPLAPMMWYHYLWNLMASPKGQLAANRVSFVTLNYDRSLERYFFRCLKAQHGYRDDDACLDELYGLRFVHVYGSLGDDRFVEPFYRRQPSPDEIWRASERLRIIHEEPAEAGYLSQAVELLKDASVICFLGYGFHALNNKRLTLAELAKEDRKREAVFDDRKWFASRFGITDVEFGRVTKGFEDRFRTLNYLRAGGQSDGALEILRRLPVIE